MKLVRDNLYNKYQSARITRWCAITLYRPANSKFFIEFSVINIHYIDGKRISGDSILQLTLMQIWPLSHSMCMQFISFCFDVIMPSLSLSLSFVRSSIQII